MNIKALSLAVAVAALAPLGAQASTVTFSGEIISTTCVPSGGTGGDYTASFGQLDSDAFTGVSSEAGMTNFDVAFTDCPTSSKIGVHFQSPLVNMASGYLNNGGDAEGVSIKIYNGAGEHVHLGRALPDSSYVMPVAGAVTLPHHATLVKTATDIVDGSVNAVATIVVQHQ